MDTRRKTVVILLSIFYLIIFYQFAYRPLRKKARILRNDLIQIKLQLVEIKRAVNRLADLEKEVRDLKEKLVSEERKLFTRGEINNFISELTSSLQKEGVEVVSLNFREDNQEKPYPPVILEIFVRGNYHRIASFISRLENRGKLESIQFFTLERISLSPVTVLGRIRLELRIKEG